MLAGSENLGLTKFKIKELPPDYLDFLNSFGEFHNLEDTAWFLMYEDYLGTSESSFAWNEFEKQSLEAALDQEDEERVKEFWGKHLPIFISVKDGYSFIALSLLEGQAGAVVVGREPEYEETSVICDDLEGFFLMLSKHVRGDEINSMLGNMV